MRGDDPAADLRRIADAYCAFAHGFVSMELAGAFRLGGDLDEAWRYGIEAAIRGLETRRRGSA